MKFPKMDFDNIELDSLESYEVKRNENKVDFVFNKNFRLSNWFIECSYCHV